MSAIKAEDAITEEVANEEEEWEGSSGKTTTYSIEVQGQPVEPDAEQLISIESIRKRKRKNAVSYTHLRAHETPR